MLGPFDYALWLAGFLAEVCLVIRAILRKDFLGYLTLNIFIAAIALNQVIRFVVSGRYGFTSMQYRYCYFYGDALLTACFFVTVISLYAHAFRDTAVARYIRILAFVALGTTAAYSFALVHNNRDLLITHFAVELSQNLYFVGTVLIYILWTIVIRRRHARMRMVLIVTAFGMYCGGQGLTYVLGGFFPHFFLWRYAPPLLGTWLPLSLLYTFVRVPEEARLPVEALEGAV